MCSFYINFGILVIYVTASGPCIGLRHYVVLTAPVIWVLAWDFLRETDFEFVVESTDRSEPVHQMSIQRSASQPTSFYTYCIWIVNRVLCVIMCWVEGAGLTRWCSQLCKWDSKGKPALVFKDKRLSIVVFSWPDWVEVGFPLPGIWLRREAVFADWPPNGCCSPSSKWLWLLNVLTKHPTTCVFVWVCDQLLACPGVLFQELSSTFQ